MNLPLYSNSSSPAITSDWDDIRIRGVFELIQKSLVSELVGSSPDTQVGDVLSTLHTWISSIKALGAFFFIQNYRLIWSARVCLL